MVVTLGKDPSALRSTGIDTTTDPSGFSQNGFDPCSMKNVLALARDAWETVVQSVPGTANVPLPASIRLYMEKTRQKQEYPAGAMIFRFDRSRADIRKRRTDAGWLVEISRYPVPEIRGIALSLTPDMLNMQADELYDIFVHEMFHILSHHALAASHILAEALVERLTSSVLKKQQSRELRYLPWNGAAFTSTCGLHIDDFAEIRRTDAFRSLISMHTLNSLQTISYDEVWRIVTKLLRQAHASGFCPRFIDILRMIQSVIGKDRMEDVLASTLIKPLREGKQCFFCPFGSEELFGFCFEVKSNPHYLQAPPEEPLGWDKYQFIVNESSTDLEVTACGKNNSIITSIAVLRGEQQLSFKSLLRFLRRTHGESFLQNDVTAIQCEALGVHVTLKRPAERSSAGCA